MTALIERIGTSVPPGSVPVEQLCDRLGLDERQVRLFTRHFGFDRIAVAEGCTDADLLLEAARDALAGIDPATVRHVVHCYTVVQLAPDITRHPQMLRERLGLEHASAFALAQQNCSSGLLAVRVAEALLELDPPGSKALIVMGERAYSPLVQVIPGTTIMGDAAAACLVGRAADREPGDRDGDVLLGAAFRTLGEFWDGRHDDPAAVAAFKAVYVDVLTAVIADAVRDAGLAMDQVALILPHNVNRMSWRQVARTLGVPLDRVHLDTLSRIGHCYCADPLLNLADARAAGRVSPGDAVVLATVGLGATFAALVLRAGDVPAAGKATP